MSKQPIYRSHALILKSGSGRARTNAYIEKTGFVDIGADIVRRGLCLPSDNKMSVQQQEIIIDIIHRCFN